MARQRIALANALVFGVAIAIIFLVTGATWAGFGEAELARSWTRHTNVVLTALQDLNLTLHEAETGQRGYLLTGDEAYLAPYLAAPARAAQLQSSLMALTADNPAQQARLRLLAPVVAGRMAVLAEGIGLRRVAGLQAATALVLSGKEHGEMADIESSLAQMTAAEQALLQERRAEIDDIGGWIRLLVATGSLLSIATLLWAARRLNRAATTDELTGLLSRNRMWELITVTVARREPLNAAMLFVDIDRFRSVNQVFGPGTGDAVLEEVGRRLKPIARPHAVGRLGGDDFAICCIGITPAAAMLLGAQAAAIVAQPFRAHGQSLHLTASVGVAHTETAGLVDIRQGADDAMYVAKSKGGNQSVAFVRSMHDQRREQAELEEALHRALDRDDEISIAFQPVLRLADRGMAAVEALARWTHPRLGSIPPDVFIPIAETRSMIIPLGLKLMDLTIAEAARWRQRHPGKMPVVNLNISPLQFAEGDVIGDLTRLLESHRMAPESICIEVTEAAVTDAHALLALQGARRQGFMVSIDDFGVGYSSLSQLPRLPLSSIKLDRSFISHAADSVGDTAMLYAIVQLAHALGLRVIAEGVERTDQLALVEAAGCDYVQGYLLSRPLSPSDLGAWLTAGGMPSALRPAGG